MAYQRQKQVRTDRFGNPFQLITALQATTKDGEVVNSFKGYVELKGQLYKLEVSERMKEHKSGKAGMWVKVTAVKKSVQNTSM